MVVCNLGPMDRGPIKLRRCVPSEKSVANSISTMETTNSERLTKRQLKAIRRRERHQNNNQVQEITPQPQLVIETHSQFVPTRLGSINKYKHVEVDREKFRHLIQFVKSVAGSRFYEWGREYDCRDTVSARLYLQDVYEYVVAHEPRNYEQASGPFWSKWREGHRYHALLALKKCGVKPAEKVYAGQFGTKEEYDKVRIEAQSTAWLLNFIVLMCWFMSSVRTTTDSIKKRIQSGMSSISNFLVNKIVNRVKQFCSQLPGNVAGYAKTIITHIDTAVRTLIVNCKSLLKKGYLAFVKVIMPIIVMVLAMVFGVMMQGIVLGLIVKLFIYVFRLQVREKVVERYIVEVNKEPTPEQPERQGDFNYFAPFNWFEKVKFPEFQIPAYVYVMRDGIPKWTNMFKAIEWLLSRGAMLLTMAVRAITGKPIPITSAEAEILERGKQLEEVKAALVLDCTQYPRYAEKIRTTYDWFRRTDNPTFNAKVHPIFQRLYFQYMSLSTELHSSLLFYEKTAKPRVEPVWVNIYGKPGLGKSYHVQTLLNSVYTELVKRGYPLPTDKYSPAVLCTQKLSDPFWDGYKNQPFVLLDDLLQIKDLTQRMQTALSLIEMISCNPVTLAAAVPENKNSLSFTSVLIVSTSNTDISGADKEFELHAKDLGIMDPEALRSRVTLPLRLDEAGDAETVVFRVPTSERYRLTDAQGTFTTLSMAQAVTVIADLMEAKLKKFNSPLPCVPAEKFPYTYSAPRNVVVSGFCDNDKCHDSSSDDEMLSAGSDDDEELIIFRKRREARASSRKDVLRASSPDGSEDPHDAQPAVEQQGPGVGVATTGATALGLTAAATTGFGWYLLSNLDNPTIMATPHLYESVMYMTAAKETSQYISSHPSKFSDHQVTSDEVKVACVIGFIDPNLDAAGRSDLVKRQIENYERRGSFLRRVSPDLTREAMFLYWARAWFQGTDDEWVSIHNNIYKTAVKHFARSLAKFSMITSAAALMLSGMAWLFGDKPIEEQSNTAKVTLKRQQKQVRTRTKAVRNDQLLGTKTVEATPGSERQNSSTYHEQINAVAANMSTITYYHAVNDQPICSVGCFSIVSNIVVLNLHSHVEVLKLYKEEEITITVSAWQEGQVRVPLKIIEKHHLHGDLIAYQVPSLAQRRNMIPRIASEVLPHLPIIRISLSGGPDQRIVVEQFDKFSIDPSKTHDFDLIIYDAPSYRGLCMAVYCQFNGRLEILGWHVAGVPDEELSFAELADPSVFKQIPEIFKDIPVKDVHIRPVAQCPVVSYIPGTIPLGETTPKMASWVPTDNPIRVTEHDPVFPDDFVSYEPANLKSTKDFDPMAYRHAKYKRPPIPYLDVSWMLPMLELTGHTPDFRNYRVLTLEEAIYGVEGEIDAIDMKTSPGYFYKKLNLTRKQLCFDEHGNRRVHPLLAADVRSIITKINEGVAVPPVVEDLLKAEVLPPEKKPRLFGASDFASFLVYKMHFYLLLKEMHKYPWRASSAVGLDPHSQWHMLFARMTGNILAGDFSAFDFGFPYYLIYLLARYFTVRLKECYHTAIKTLLYSSVMAVHVYKTHIYQTVQGNPSGIFLTIFLNNFFNKVIHMVAFLTDYPTRKYKDYVQDSFTGDDSLIAVKSSPSFNMIRLAELSRRYFGIEYTTPEKGEVKAGYTTIEEVMYVGRMFVNAPGEFCYAPLRKRVFNKIVMFTHAKNPIERTEWATSVSRTLLEEAFHLGRVEYDKVRKYVEKFCDQEKIPYPPVDFDSILAQRRRDVGF